MPRDWIREFYEEGGYIKPRRNPAEAINRVRAAGGGRIGFASEGLVKPLIKPLVRKATELWKDIPSKHIADWAWNPLSKVAEGLPSEVPEHVLQYGDFMRRMANKAGQEGLDPRDILKAYSTTLASIQRQGRNRDLFPGMKFSSDEQMIRPEGAFADWLGTKAGQRFLNRGAQGEMDPEAIFDMQSRLHSFGLMDTLGKRLLAAPQLIQGKEGRFSEVVDRARRGASDPSEWSDVMEGLPGIQAAKKGFMGSLIGYGDRPTFDARQINLNVPGAELRGDAAKARDRIISNMMNRGGGEGGEEAVARLAARQRALGYELPPEYDPYYQHLAHHTTWDAAANARTTHADLMDMMENRARGGRIGFANLGRVPGEVASDVARSVKPGLIRFVAGLNPRWVSPVQEAARTAQTSPEEVARLITKAPWMQGESKSQGISLHVPRAPYSDVRALLAEHSPLLPSVPKNPEDYKGARIIGAVGDRGATDKLLFGLNEHEFADPVFLHGGEDYSRGIAGRKGLAWASDKGPIGGYINLANKALAEGRIPILAPMSMGRKAIDSSKEMTNILNQMVPFHDFSRADERAFNAAIRDQLSGFDVKKFPGIRSPNFVPYQENLPTSLRSIVPLEMDKADWVDRGFPDVGTARLGMTSSGALANPMFSSGRVMNEIDPSRGHILNPENPHPNYLSHLGGQYSGDLGWHIPAEIMYPTDYARRMQSQSPARSILMSPLTHDVDDQWIDTISRWRERAAREGIPRARGGRIDPRYRVHAFWDDEPTAFARGGSVHDRELYHPSMWQDEWEGGW